MISVSVTHLEQFRRYMAPVYESDNEKNLIASIQGKFKQTPEMKIGSAWHNLIDDPANTTQMMGMGKWWVISEGVAIPLEEAEKVEKYKKAHPALVSEIPIGKEYTTAYGPVAVSGRVDGLNGAVIHDSKVRFRELLIDEEYTDSSQWKWYLDMWGVKQLVYDVWEVRGFKKLTKSPEGIYYPNALKVKKHEPIACYAYPSMHNYLTDLLNEFIEWIYLKNIAHLLKQVETAQKYLVWK